MAFWAAAAPIIASMAGGAINSLMGEGEEGSTGYDMPMMDSSPWDYTNQKLSNQIAQNMALNAQAGRLPAGVEIMLDRIKKNQMKQSKEQMYGTAGRRGGSTMDNTMAMGAMGGVGPKAMMAQGSKAMQDYASRNSQIQNYIDSIKASGLQSAQQNAITAMQSTPRSMEIPYTGQIVQQNTPAQAGQDTGLQNVDWASFMKNAGLFNQQNTSQYGNTVVPQQTFTGGVTGATPSIPGW